MFVYKFLASTLYIFFFTLMRITLFEQIKIVREYTSRAIEKLDVAPLCNAYRLPPQSGIQPCKLYGHKI